MIQNITKRINIMNSDDIKYKLIHDINDVGSMYFR